MQWTINNAKYNKKLLQLCLQNSAYLVCAMCSSYGLTGHNSYFKKYLSCFSTHNVMKLHFHTI